MTRLNRHVYVNNNFLDAEAHSPRSDVWIYTKNAINNNNSNNSIVVLNRKGTNTWERQVITNIKNNVNKCYYELITTQTWQSCF